MIDNKVVLISGAAGKLGEALSKEVLENNGKVVLVDINSEKLFDLIKTLPPSKVLGNCCDVSKEDFSKVIELVWRHLGLMLQFIPHIPSQNHGVLHLKIESKKIQNDFLHILAEH